ncbi:NADPH:quinone oxidoreductase family protein [Sphingomonas aracearum]|uniref:NADPH:quinone oxidoreductase family protein n=2 Tax=Sphingomonas aracearum TaxID=2283317 RepID=A0A369W0L3_9SPHN|nr:NADPH:quinone oxidoreductase family protein [Sphingomonas aracearum]RDE07477.1 NADPH:quinone oxidoreductase family protein [Sphingomonas aracearum]
MRALVVSALSDDLSGTAPATVAAPVRGPEQVLVRVRAASLNYPDLLMTRGAYQLKPPLPFVPGMEVAGEVIEAAAGTGFAPGDRVVAATRTGGLAEQVAVDAARVRALPEALDFATAASIGAVYLTAYVALVRLARVQPGEWVLVHGASGGVGLAALDLAQVLGARAIATSRSAEKRAWIAERFAVPVLPATGFRAAVKELTGGGADVVVDPVGGDVFDESTRCIAFGGRLLVTGFTSGRIATVPSNIPLIKGFSVIGVRAGEYARRYPERGAENEKAIWDMAARGLLRPHVDAALPLARWREAFESLQGSRHRGKLVLLP